MKRPLKKMQPGGGVSDSIPTPSTSKPRPIPKEYRNPDPFSFVTTRNPNSSYINPDPGFSIAPKGPFNKDIDPGFYIGPKGSYRNPDPKFSVGPKTYRKGGSVKSKKK